MDLVSIAFWWGICSLLRVYRLRAMHPGRRTDSLLPEIPCASLKWEYGTEGEFCPELGICATFHSDFWSFLHSWGEAEPELGRFRSLSARLPFAQGQGQSLLFIQRTRNFFSFFFIDLSMKAGVRCSVELRFLRCNWRSQIPHHFSVEIICVFQKKKLFFMLPNADCIFACVSNKKNVLAEVIAVIWTELLHTVLLCFMIC